MAAEQVLPDDVHAPARNGAGELHEALAQVAAALDESGIDEDPDFRRSVFLRLLDYRLGGDAANTDRQPERLIGNYLGISEDAAAALFEFRGRNPIPMLNEDDVPLSVERSVEELALLTCGARTALGMQTAVGDIREVAGRYDACDSSFIDHLSAVEGLRFDGTASDGGQKVALTLRGAQRASWLAGLCTG